MRSRIFTRHLRSLSKTSAVFTVAVMGSACSSDASRLDQLLTNSVSATQNQAAIIQKSDALNQPYPETASVSRVTQSGIRVVKPQVTAQTISRPVVPSVSRSSLPVVTPVKTSLDQYKNSAVSAKNTVQNQVAAIPQVPSYQQTVMNTPTVTPPPGPKPVYASNNGAIVLPPRQTPQNPLRMTGVDAISTSSVSRPDTIGATLKTARSYQTAALTQKKPEDKKPVGWENSKGARVTVKEGETLYNLARRYGVPVSAITAANNLPNADSVQAGQRILIPTYNYSHSVPVSAPDSNPVTKASRASRGFQGQARHAVTVPKRRAQRPTAEKTPVAQAPTPVAQAPASVPRAATTDYQVQSGDTLHRIALNHGTSVVALKNANGLTSDSIRIGQKLRIPAVGGRVIAGNSSKTDQISTGSIKITQPKKRGVNPVQVKPVPEASIASRSKEKVKTVASTGAGSFRWPAAGRVISKFGERTDTGINDGIDISVPVGTPIKASENGTVIYSGSELEDFGKLILLSHEGGWVSAYAHASSALVRRGDKVRRGQVIAKSGRTGNATVPKLHFELRKNSKPVNPLGKLSK